MRQNITKMTTAAILAAISAIEDEMAIDILKTTDLHHRTAQRMQIDPEHNAAVAAAANDLARKRRHADAVERKRPRYFDGEGLSLKPVRNPPETPRGYH
jgi:hypothetical protein